MARLLSVNVGLPREIERNGKTVRKGGWQQLNSRVAFDKNEGHPKSLQYVRT